MHLLERIIFIYRNILGHIIRNGEAPCTRTDFGCKQASLSLTVPECCFESSSALMFLCSRYVQIKNTQRRYRIIIKGYELFLHQSVNTSNIEKQCFGSKLQLVMAHGRVLELKNRALVA
jgi:hypothetical protein